MNISAHNFPCNSSVHDVQTFPISEGKERKVYVDHFIASSHECVSKTDFAVQSLNLWRELKH